jgi:glycosyltransferase involved in cell wall biosynthesis
MIIETNMQPKVSVIIPVYNVSAYIERCVHSLFKQKLEDIEFVFVDDSSTDNSMEILKSILVHSYPERFKQTKIIRHDRNRGVAAVRNTGLDNATGAYVGWTDPDDWVDVEMFLQLYNTAIENDSDIVWCDFFLCTKNDKYLHSMRNAEDGMVNIKALLLDRRHGNLWTSIAKRELYFEHGIRFLEGFDVMEDKYVLVQLMFFAKNIKYIPRPLYYYEKNNSMSYTSSWDDLGVPQTAMGNLNAMIRFLDNTDLKKELYMEMKYAKLIVKKGLLNSLNIQSFRIWKELFEEENKYVLSCPNMTLKQRILGWCIHQGWWMIAKIWIKVKNSLIHLT